MCIRHEQRHPCPARNRDCRYPSYPNDRKNINSVDKRKATDESPEKSKAKRVRRRKGADVDWSSLPPDEFLRREEQRRKQKEAAERRASTDDSKNTNNNFRHPLNSERRRANRRKPKWSSRRIESSGINIGKVDHNTSGYQARRDRQSVRD